MKMKRESPKEKPSLAHINRIIGQTKALREMVENKRDCEEIIQQIIAVRSSLAKLGINMLHSETISCLEPERQKKLIESVFKFK